MSTPSDPTAGLAAAVPGVASAAADSVAGLRVRLAPGADGTEVVLAVGRLLLAASDPVPVTQPRQMVTVPAPRSAGRPRVVRLDLHTDGPAFVVGVALSCAGRTAQGTGRSALTATGTRRAVAAATLQAVQGLLARPVHLELAQVERSDAAEVPVVLVHVSLVGPAGVQRLSGSAVVREDESTAVMRATLDAVNRRVAALLEPSG